MIFEEFAVRYRRYGLFVRLWTLKQPFMWFGIGMVLNAILLPFYSCTTFILLAVLFFFIGRSDRLFTAILLLSSFLLGAGLIYQQREELTFREKNAKILPKDFFAEFSATKISMNGKTGIGIVSFSNQPAKANQTIRFVLTNEIHVERGRRYFAHITRQRWNSPMHPKDFDEGAFFSSTGCFFKGEIDQLFDEGAGSTSANFMYNYRDQIHDLFKRVLEPHASGMLLALFTGDKSGLDYSFVNDFRHLGLMHLFAVSGFHVGLLFALIIKLLPRFKKEKIRVLIALILVWFYISFIDFPISAVRAGIMLSAAVWGILNGRRLFSWANFWLAFFIIIIVHPAQIYAPGFVLSFSALAGILFFLPTINHHISLLRKRNCQRFTLYFQGIFEISFAAQVGVLLPATYWFGTLNLFSPLINIIMVPIVVLFMTIALPLFILAILGIPFSAEFINAASAFIANCGHFLSSFYMEISPWEYFPFSIFVFFILLIGYWSYRAWAAVYLNYILMGSLIIFTLFYPFDIPVKIIQLDVGQGDACYIRSAGRQFLVDAGYKKMRFSSAIKKLMDNGKFETIFITHPDADHFGGLLTTEPLMENGQLFVSDTIGGAWYKSLLREYKKHSNKILIPQTGIIAGNSYFRIYCLDNGRIGKKLKYDKNNSSLILLIQTRKWSYLLTGDAEWKQERFLHPWKAILQLSILKVGHHGSRKGTSDFLLDLVNPKLAVISCGFENHFGHPNKENLKRLNNHHISIYRTDLQGYWTSPTDQNFPINFGDQK